MTNEQKFGGRSQQSAIKNQEFKIAAPEGSGAARGWAVGKSGKRKPESGKKQAVNYSTGADRWKSH